GEVSNENPKIKYALKTLILRYLINGQGVDSTGEYKHYRDVKDGNIYFANFNGRCQLRLSKTFKNKENLFIEAAEKLKGRHISFGDHGFTFSFLPKIDVYVVLWSGDEEFPPEAQILFSDNVEYYFTAEDLAFVGDTINDRLAEKAFS
ncbi:MAG TPA: hypothetical protein DHN33_11585, partial [Eubacteriaceae bacterium]|nr:hypothetical protein [Eubacteriaceae bacterium]